MMRRRRRPSLDSKSFERWTTSDLSALLFCEHDENNDVGVMASGTKNTKYLLRLNYDTEGATERIACLRLESCVWVMVESGSQHESKVLHLQRVMWKTFRGGHDTSSASRFASGCITERGGSRTLHDRALRHKIMKMISSEVHEDETRSDSDVSGAWSLQLVLGKAGSGYWN